MTEAAATIWFAAGGIYVNLAKPILPLGAHDEGLWKGAGLNVMQMPICRRAVPIEG